MLSKSEEHSLTRWAKLKSTVIETRKQYLQSKGKYLTDEDLAALYGLTVGHFTALMSRSDSARTILIRCNMRLVMSVALKYRYHGLSYSDLIQEGSVGLFRSIDKYDPDRGFRLSTYASVWIKQSITRALSDKSRLIRVPGHVNSLFSTIYKFERDFVKSYHRHPTVSELSQALGIDSEMIKNVLFVTRPVHSADVPIYQNFCATNVKDRIVSDVIEPQMIRESIDFMCDELINSSTISGRERDILHKRFQSKMTFKAISGIYNLSCERIRQLQNSALDKVRQSSRMEGMNSSDWVNEVPPSIKNSV